jgi:pyruvate-ferredoxin/flavodoxin oxidoreductase
MGGRINTVMQTCFFAISGILPKEEAIAQIKQSIKKTYGKRGEAVVQRNFRAVDETLTHLFEVNVPVGLAVGATSESNGSALPRRAPIALPVLTRRPAVAAESPTFVREVLGPMIAGEGDSLPVSALPTRCHS